MYTCGPAFFGTAATVGSLYKSELLFNQANGSTIFPDAGTLGATWAGSGGATNSNVPPAPLEGIGSLLIGSTSDYIESSGVMLPPTADWDLSFIIRPLSTVGSTYLASVQDGSASAGGTQFVVYIGSTPNINFYVSDGSSRYLLFAGSINIGVGTTYSLLLTRRTSTIALTVNGVPDGSGSFSGTFPVPSGGVLRIGKPVFGPGLGMDGLYDVFRLNY